MSGPVRIEKSPSDVALTWLDEQTLEMVLADNTTHQILLNVAENIPGLVAPCLFSGTIEGDLEAVVSVSGCKGKDTEVSIASRKILGGLADLFLSDDKTYQIIFHKSREEILTKKNRTRRQAGLQRSLVKLTWKRAREIDVVFTDGTRDKIQLQPVSNIPCLFTGSLLNDRSSEVTVDGCRGGQRQVHVEILSKMAPGGFLKLIMMNGRTYKVAPDNTSWRGEADDVIVPDPGEDIMSDIAPWVGPLPQAVILEITHLRYDNSLLAEFGNNPTEVKLWLSKVVELAKPKMSLLDLRVHLRVGTVEHYNKEISVSDSWIRKIGDTENKGIKGPISYFCGPGNLTSVKKNSSFNSGSGTTLGIAFLSTACDTETGSQINMVKKQESITQTAKTFAHELGHNIGMQ